MTLMSRVKTVSLITVFFLICVTLDSARAKEEISNNPYQISDIKWQQKDGAWLYQIKGDIVPAYTMYELFSPHRVVVDIANGVIAGSAHFPVDVKQGPVSVIKGEVHADQNPPIARIELLLSVDRAYSVTGSGNDILVRIEAAAAGAEKGLTKNVAQEIHDVTITGSGNTAQIHLLAAGPIQTYQSTEVAKGKDHPARLMVDLPGVAAKDHAIPAHEGSPVAVVRTERYKDGTRIILDSAADALFSYSIAAQEKGLTINVETAADAGAVISGITGLSADEIARLKSKQAPADAEPDKTPSASVSKSTKPAETGGKTDFTLAGYTAQKISVDFYKIDLHNVFRLIGEISGRNIVVDEGVSGSLTLTLNDVPWDFVLEVILNLKDLAKEERFNTIVISQKSDEFIWPAAPEQAEEKLAIKEEAISVTKKMDVSKEKLEARQFIRQGKNLEDAGNYAEALASYEKAFQSWSDNGELAKRIAYLALIKLRLNAKAAHYGQIAATLLPQDAEVALQTALGLANMEQVKEAKNYFDFAVSGEHPSRQALASYAAFSEQNGSNEMALALLSRFEQIYGTSLETMISKARIYDKLGEAEKASKEYQAVILSGYQVPADLEKYIKERLHK
ncbi:MAG: hypothetical protein HY885_04760 [Deltaproteobacteria bacterium]|nr:hypothetical protein [Deltaproteobacteria bacterium]